MRSATFPVELHEPAANAKKGRSEDPKEQFAFADVGCPAGAGAPAGLHADGDRMISVVPYFFGSSDLRIFDVTVGASGSTVNAAMNQL